jgi:hypothetical protein
MPSPENGLGYCIERQLVGRARPVIDALRAAGLSVATAESCTAGLIAAILQRRDFTRFRLRSRKRRVGNS